MDQRKEQEEEENLSHTAKDDLSNISDSLTIDELLKRHKVETQEQLCDKMQKYIQKRSPYVWKDKKNVPVICSVCKRTVMKDGFPNKHLNACWKSYPNEHL